MLGVRRVDFSSYKWKQYIPIVAIAVISAVIGGTIVAQIGSNPKTQMDPIGQLTPPTAHAQISQARNTAIVRAAEQIGPTVVGITNKAYARDFFNRKVLVEQGTGSGVIFDAKGYIATNHHVVNAAQELIVTLADGRTVPGKVLGSDAVTDLAVVKVDVGNLPAAPFGDSDGLKVGEPAIAIGNPLGLEFQRTVTAGVISAVNRPLEIAERKFKLIQTDAAINPGNSGGALVNAEGQVIGINSAKIALAGVEGIGFAIPVNTARPILQELMEQGRVARPWLGVGIIDAATGAKLGYANVPEKGVLIVRVATGSPAAKAGLKEGDVITKLAGIETNTVADLRSTVDQKKIGESVEVLFSRNGKELNTNVVFSDVPSEQ
jgi:serine protease Do